MIEFTSNFDLIELDVKRYTKTLDRVLGQIIRESAREWLRAVLKSVPARGGFPVLTGAAKSTLVPLGRFVRVAVSVSPTEGDRRSLGVASQHFKIVDNTNNSGTFLYSFEWSTSLLHYYINEFYGYIPYAPWNTVEAGETAFKAYIEKAMNTRLPEIADYISVIKG